MNNKLKLSFLETLITVPFVTLGIVIAILVSYIVSNPSKISWLYWIVCFLGINISIFLLNYCIRFKKGVK